VPETVKNKKRILVGIYTCPKFSARAMGVRETWLKLIPDNIRVLFVFGRPKQKASIEEDCLYRNCPEAYEKLPEKTLAFLQYCSANLEFDYVFKVDDDTYIDMEKFLSFDTQEGDYIGQFTNPPQGKFDRTWHFGKCTDKSLEVPDESEFICPWATGAGYFLSPKAVDLAIKRTTHTVSKSMFEDKMIGEALTLDASLKVIRTGFSQMGVLNPLNPGDMQYMQNILLERQSLAKKLDLLRMENLQLQETLREKKAFPGVG
jgi:hypothetical protein